MAGGGSKPGERRGGRKKGTPNKVSSKIKDMVLEALDELGGKDYLVEQAKKNPAAYMGLLGKILPTQLTGTDDGPMKIRWIAHEEALQELE